MHDCSIPEKGHLLTKLRFNFKHRVGMDQIDYLIIFGICQRAIFLEICIPTCLHHLFLFPAAPSFLSLYHDNNTIWYQSISFFYTDIICLQHHTKNQCYPTPTQTQVQSVFVPQGLSHLEKESAREIRHTSSTTWKLESGIAGPGDQHGMNTFVQRTTRT